MFMFQPDEHHILDFKLLQGDMDAVDLNMKLL